MKILHIISQKPEETGSGIYVKNMIKEFEKKGYSQCLIAGLDQGEKANISSSISVYPVYFSTTTLPFNVVGMSDVMPYRSSRYRDLGEYEVNAMMNAFKKAILEATKVFKPDIIICHHLYLITALTVNILNTHNIYGVCHGTDLRQIKSHGLMKEFIIKNIKRLKGIFSLHEESKKEIINIFKIPANKIYTIGIGYDDKIFYDKGRAKNEDITLVYTGKISYAKGLIPLFYGFRNIQNVFSNVKLKMVGMGQGQEYDKIKELYGTISNVEFLGKLSQDNLSELYSNSHIFILPSFYEGLPLVIVEALASGLYVVTSNIPGVSQWLGEEINSSKKIEYIELPSMETVDVPKEDAMEEYIDNMTKAIEKVILRVKGNEGKNVDTTAMTWKGLSDKVMDIIKNQ